MRDRNRIRPLLPKTDKVLHSDVERFAYRWVRTTMRASNDQFRELLEQHQRMVFGIAVRLIGDRSEAEEVAQDVFLELYDSIGKLESTEHVKFWLRRVAVHRATDALRRRVRRPELVAEAWEERHETAYENPDEMPESDVAERLEQMLRALPEPYRTTVVLRYADEATPDEIAAILQRPVATVKSHLQRGLGMLRQKAGVMLKERTR